MATCSDFVMWLISRRWYLPLLTTDSGEVKLSELAFTPHFFTSLRCGVTVWYGDHNPLYCTYAEEEDRRPPPSGWGIVGIYKVCYQN